MKRFRFSLATVLRVRRSTEERLRREFSVIVEKRIKALAVLAALELALKELNAWQSDQRSQASKLNRFELGQFEVSRNACIERGRWQRDLIVEIERELEVKRTQLVDASRETKVIEKLEESQFQAYLEKLNREDQAFMDELAQFSARDSMNPSSQNSVA
jgi:flagellar FliJ protein